MAVLGGMVLEATQTLPELGTSAGRFEDACAGEVAKHSRLMVLS